MKYYLSLFMILLLPETALAVAPYDGGTGSGWCMTDTAFYIGSGMWSTSAADQTFVTTQASTPITPLLIQFDASALPTVSSGMSLMIPAGLQLAWDPNINTPTLTGSASPRFSPTVTFSNNNKNVNFTLTSNVVIGDNLTISGLNFTNFTAWSPTEYHLGLDTNADGLAEYTDLYNKGIWLPSDQSSVYSGGTGDGWFLREAGNLLLGPSVIVKGGVTIKGGVTFNP